MKSFTSWRGARFVVLLFSLLGLGWLPQNGIAQVTPCPALTGDLVAWYRFEGTSEDAIGRYPGVSVGEVSFTDGKIGIGAKFGKVAGVRIGNAPGLRPQQLSVAAWVKSTPPGSYRYIVSKSLDRAVAASYGFYSSGDGRLRFYVCHTLSPFLVTFSPAAPAGIWDNAWHWVVGTYDRNEVVLYVDGKPTGPGCPGNQPILYGTSAFNGDLFIGNGENPTPTPRINLQWPGSIDEVQLFNRALTAGEVAGRFTQNSTGFCFQEGRPAFSSLPPSQQFKIGRPLTLQATVTGLEPLQFQWRKNGAPIAGATKNTLSITAADLDDGGGYQLEVSNPLGTIVSDPIPVFPELAVINANDVFLRAGVFSGLTGVGVTSNQLATLETGEPLHAGRRGGHSIWLRYLAPDTGLMTISTRGSDFDTLLGVYDGDAVDLLTVKASSDDEPERVTSQVSFPVRKGRTYRVAVDGRAGATGTVVFRWNLQPTAVELLEIIRQPVSRTVSLGGLAIFNLSALGAKTFQWMHNGVPLQNKGRISGVDESQVVIKDAGLADLGIYEAEMTDTINRVRTERVSLQINPGIVGLAVETFGVADKLADVLDDLGAKLTGAARVGARPWPAGLATGTSGTQIFNTFGASAEPGEPVHCGVGSGHSQWFAYQAVADGLMVFDTVGSTFDTVLAIYRDTGSGVDLYDGLISIGCNNDATPEIHTSRVVVSMEKNTIYYVAIDSVVGAAPGTAVLNYQTFPGTRLTAQPVAVPGELRLTVEGVTGVAVELQSSATLGNWNTLFSTNASADQFGLKVPTSGRSTELFRALVH